MNNVFKTKLDTASLVLIPACIGINYLGKLFASVLKLPLWLDAIGTCIGGALGGPIIGAICGAANNLIYGFTTGDNITLIYALTSLFIGLVVGIMARIGFMKTFPKALLTACAGGLAAVVVSTPLNILFWGGTTGNVWGDAVFAATQAAKLPLALGSLLDEIVVDVPDKLITLIIVFLILKGLPKKLTTLYDTEETIESLDKFMKTISLYTNNGSWLTQLHPFTKLWYLAAAICIPLLTGSLWGFAVMIIISFVLLKSGRLIKKALPLIAFSFTIILTIFLIHGLVNQQNKNVLFAIGFLKFYKEGLLYAAHIGLNILNMLLSFAIVVLSTRPSELVDELERKGFSPRFGYIINSVFQIIPQMMGTMHTITDAQRSRGMETEGNLLVRIKAFLPLISPVVMSALTATRERAIALEVRGFGVKGTKTWMHPHKKTKADRIFSWLCIISLILAVIATENLNHS